MKVCNKCGTEKSKDEFHKRSASIDGLQAKCKSCDKAHEKKWYSENTDRQLNNSRKWQANNKDRVIENMRAWGFKNKEARNAYAKAWAIANPERRQLAIRARRARKMHADGSHSLMDIEILFDRQRGLCANCTCKLVRSGRGGAHLDHITPLSKGGSNWPWNLQFLCAHCNLTKHAKDPIEWAKQNWKLI